MAPHIGAMAGCSGDHSKYQEAVAVAEAKVAEAISEAEEGHRSGAGPHGGLRAALQVHWDYQG